ncbi:DUF448 domain-containing protein [bacterium]|nr:DUF448 domain-containing protein [bacterium]
MACRKRREKDRLLRIVRSVKGRIFFDPDQNREGRGAYLCPDAGCLETTRKRGLLAVSLKTSIPDGIFLELAGALKNRPHEAMGRMLGFCIKARKAVLGTQAVLEGLKRQKIGIVFISDQAAPGTRSRLNRACARASVPLAALQAAMIERSNVRVVGVLQGDFAVKLKEWI